MDNYTIIEASITAVHNDLQKLIALATAQAAAPTTAPVPTRDDLLNGAIVPYAVQTLPLDNARTDWPIVMDGTLVFATVSGGSLTGIGARFNNLSADIINFADVNPLPKMQFYKLFLTNTAQAGAVLKLYALKTSMITPGSIVNKLSAANPAVNLFTSPTPPPAVMTVVYTDCRGAITNLLFSVFNHSDVTVTVQVVGAIFPTFYYAVSLGSPILIPAYSGQWTGVTIGLDLRGTDWHPYMGLSLLPAAGATTGNITVDAYTKG
jgi:hypothetical protein